MKLLNKYISRELHLITVSLMIQFVVERLKQPVKISVAVNVLKLYGSSYRRAMFIHFFIPRDFPVRSIVHSNIGFVFETACHGK